MISRRFINGVLLAAGIAGGGCRSGPRPGALALRTGDEIAVAGQFFHTGTPVMLWLDPGGYDAYRVERRPCGESGWRDSTAGTNGPVAAGRYGLREEGLTPAQIERVRGGGCDLRLLRRMVDQFVIHYDAAGLSRECFKSLQDERGLSVHFLLDIDGTLYQTLDLKERAWHATTSNSRSVGVEIANAGAFQSETSKQLQTWYKRDARGQTTIVIPAELGDGGVRTPGFTGHPARPNLVRGGIQGRDMVQYDYTPEQYAALVKLTAALCRIFPKLPCRHPTDDSGRLITHKLPDAQLKNYQGVLGHYHIQENKEDPGPAFNWDYVIGNARRLLNHGFAPPANETSMGQGRARF